MKRQASDDIAMLKVLAATCLRPVGCQDWGRQIRFQARMLYPFQTSCPSGALGESAGHLLTAGKAPFGRYMFCKAQPGKLGPRTAGTGSGASPWLSNGTWLGVITRKDFLPPSQVDFSPVYSITTLSTPLHQCSSSGPFAGHFALWLLHASLWTWPCWVHGC